MKSILSSVVIGSFFIGFSSAVAAETSHTFADVPPTAWYFDAVQDLSLDGRIDTSKEFFEPGRSITRAELVKLLFFSFPLYTTYTSMSFSDVRRTAWYYQYLEDAGANGEITGDGNCYGTMPCYARPDAFVTRAEAAVLAVRSMSERTSHEKTMDAPAFSDVPSGAWYAEAMQIAADHCVLQSLPGSRNVRPNDLLNRAEAVQLIQRIGKNLAYGTDCGSDADTKPRFIEVYPGGRGIPMMFNVDIDPVDAARTDRYAVSIEGPGETNVLYAYPTGPRSVMLYIDESMSSCYSGTLSVLSLRRSNGEQFTLQHQFNICADYFAPHFSAYGITPNTVEVDASFAFAADPSKVNVQLTQSGSGIGIVEKKQGRNEWQLRLTTTEPLVCGTTYTLTLRDISTNYTYIREDSRELQLLYCPPEMY